MNAKYIDVLLEEIRQFQANTKKKYAEVKEEASKLSTFLEKLKRTLRDGADKTDIRFPFDLLNSIGHAASSTQKQKPNVNFMNILGRVLTFKMVSSEPELFEVLKYADKIASIQKDKLLIKLQQILFQLIDPSILSILNFSYAHLVLSVIVKIRRVIENPMIHSLNYTIQSQVISTMCQQATKYHERQSVQDNFNILFKDLFVLAQGESLSWLTKELPNTQELGVECMRIMMEEGEKTFRNCCELENCMINEVAVWLDRVLLTNQDDQSEFYLKCVVLLGRFLTLINDKYEMLSRIDLKLGAAKANNSPIVSRIQFAAISAHMNVFNKLESFQKYIISTFSPNTPQCSFLRFLKSLSEILRAVVGKLQNSSTHNNISILQKARWPSGIGQQIDLYSSQNPQPYEILQIALTLISSACENYVSMWQKISGSPLNIAQLASKQPAQKFSSQEEEFRMFYEETYRSIYNCLKMTICALNISMQTPNHSMLDLLFENIKRMLVLSLAICKPKAFNHFFKLLAQSTITKACSLDYKFKLAADLFFLVIESFSYSMNQICWENAVMFLRFCNFVISKEEDANAANNSIQSGIISPSKAASYSQPNSPSTESNEEIKKSIIILIEKIKVFFKQTDRLSGIELNFLISALESSTYDLLEGGAEQSESEIFKRSSSDTGNISSFNEKTLKHRSGPSIQKSNPSSDLAEMHDAFTFLKLQEVVSSNMHRAGLIWKGISAFLITTGTCKDTFFRGRSIQLLGFIIISLSEYYIAHPSETLDLENAAKSKNIIANETEEAKEKEEEQTSAEAIQLGISPKDEGQIQQQLQENLNKTQSLLFGAWESLISSEYEDVKQDISEDISYLIGNSKGGLTVQGRRCLLTVLAKLAEGEYNQLYLQNYQSMMNLLSECKPEDSNTHEVDAFVKAIQAFINNSGDELVIFHSCSLFLKLAEVLYKLSIAQSKILPENQENTHAVMMNARDILFCLAQISVHPNAQIREQALDALSTAIIEYSQNYETTFWTETIFKDILFKVSSDTIKRLYESMQQSNNDNTPTQINNQKNINNQKQNNNNNNNSSKFQDDFFEWQSTSLQLIDSVTEITCVFVGLADKTAERKESLGIADGERLGERLGSIEEEEDVVTDKSIPYNNSNSKGQQQYQQIDTIGKSQQDIGKRNNQEEKQLNQNHSQRESQDNCKISDLSGNEKENHKEKDIVIKNLNNTEEDEDTSGNIDKNPIDLQPRLSQRRNSQVIQGIQLLLTRELSNRREQADNESADGSHQHKSTLNFDKKIMSARDLKSDLNIPSIANECTPSKFQMYAQQSPKFERARETSKKSGDFGASDLIISPKRQSRLSGVLSKREDGSIGSSIRQIRSMRSMEGMDGVNNADSVEKTTKKHELSHFGFASMPPKIQRLKSFSKKDEGANSQGISMKSLKSFEKSDEIEGREGDKQNEGKKEDGDFDGSGGKIIKNSSEVSSNTEKSNNEDKELPEERGSPLIESSQIKSQKDTKFMLGSNKIQLVLTAGNLAQEKDDDKDVKYEKSSFGNKNQNINSQDIASEEKSTATKDTMVEQQDKEEGFIGQKEKDQANNIHNEQETIKQQQHIEQNINDQRESDKDNSFKNQIIQPTSTSQNQEPSSSPPSSLSQIAGDNQHKGILNKDKLACIELYLIILGDFISFKIFDITFLCIKDIASFFSFSPQYAPQLQTELINIIHRLDDYFSQIPETINITQNVLHHGITDTIPLLREIFRVTKSPRKREHEQLIASSMVLLYKILIFPQLAQQTFNHVLDEGYSYSSEDTVFELLQELVELFKEKRSSFKSLFVQFLREFFQEDLSDLYFHHIISKLLPLIQVLVLNEPKKNKPYCFQFLILIKNLLSLKHSSNYHHFWVATLPQNQQPIWNQAANVFVQIASALLAQQINVSQILDMAITFVSHEFNEKEKLNFKSEEDMMLFLDHDKAMLLFIVKAFALEQSQLLEKYSAQSFSQFCLEALFQISNFIEGSSEIRRIRSQLFLPFFLSRASSIFDKFILTIDTKTGIKPPSIKEAQVKQFLHFLENLQNLTIPPATFLEFKQHRIYQTLPFRPKKNDSPLFNNFKGHIAYLLPYLLNCTLCNQLEVRIQLKSIISGYHQEIGVIEVDPSNKM